MKLAVYLFTPNTSINATTVAIAPETITPIANPFGIEAFTSLKQARTSATTAKIRMNHPSPLRPFTLYEPKAPAFRLAHGKKELRIATAAEIMINKRFFSIISLLIILLALFYHKK